MLDGPLIHTHLDGIADYCAALDTLCQLAHKNLYLFDKNFEGLGFNAVARYETLRHFLLANPASRLFILAHDTHYLSTHCPRMALLLRHFDNQMTIRQTHLQHVTAPFCVTDNVHYVRRFHFDDLRGIFAQNDPENARALEATFIEMWGKSHQSVAPTTLGI